MSEKFNAAAAHARLGDAFFDRVEPADFPKAMLRYRNQPWAERMGLGTLDDRSWIDHFGRFIPLPGSFTQPLALRYHGHQFQSYNPDLGDGRGFLFAQGYDLIDGKLRDFGTKGSGQTPWSRGGDGRLTLKGGVREVLASSMLEAIGVETSKSFSLIETGEDLYRGDEPSPARSSVLVRLSHSHIRIGTFQRLADLGDHASMALLVDHVATHYYLGIADIAPLGDKAALLLGEIASAVARVTAQWIAAGFVHGVLNSDNINITGESFDYGPWRFLPAYDPGFTAAYFDQSGLYAFGRQPDAVAWNLTRLAECLVPLSSIEKLEPELNRFWPEFQRQLGLALVDRLGLVSQNARRDGELAAAFFAFSAAEAPRYEQTFFDWRGGAASKRRAAQSPQAKLYESESFAALAHILQSYETGDARLDHPYFARAAPLTMLIEDVEALWAPIAERDDWSAFDGALQKIAEMGSAYGRGIFTAM